MTPDELNSIKARLSAGIARDRTPAAAAFRRFVQPALENQAARPAATPPATRQRGTREQLLDAGFVFSVHDQDQAASDAEHRARRRIATAETTAREQTYRSLRDSHGLDAADAWMRGQS
jgi:hypothetical protein